MASSIDAEAERSVVAGQEVNSGAYLQLQNGQIFEQGLSFSGNERDKVWLNAGGAASFVDLSDVSGADSPNDGRAALAADFDDDGDVDLFVHHAQRERHALLRNDAARPGSAASGFLKVRLRATSGHWEAIGATVVVRPAGAAAPCAQVATRGAGFVSCAPPELVFGLGAAKSATVEVRWPGGRRESFGELAANGRVLLVEGAGAAEALAAHPRSLPDPLPAGLQLDTGDLAPPARVLDTDGREAVLDFAALADGRDHVLVNFWASYCAPCVAELPRLEQTEQRGELRVVTISLDAPDDRARAAALLRERAPSVTGYSLRDDATGLEGLIDLDRLALPTSLILTPDGRVDTIVRGPLE